MFYIKKRYLLKFKFFDSNFSQHDQPNYLLLFYKIDMNAIYLPLIKY